MELLQYKCPCCGAPLSFSGEAQQMKCASCGNEYPVETLEQFKELDVPSAEKELAWKHKGGGAEMLREGVYLCPSCGAEVACDENTASTRCPYCDNVVVIGGSLTGEFAPDSVIPFSVEADAAKKKLRELCKGKRLLPKNFLDENRIKDVRGYYVPFWLFDCDCAASVSFDATKTRRWSDSSYDYTETSYYLVNRAGGMSFSHIPVDGSVKMDDASMESIEPYDYSGMTDFAPAYLAGYDADKFDVGSDEALRRADERVFNSAEAALRGTVQGYDTVYTRSRNVRTKNGEVSYALLPVWLLESKYRDRLYQFAINGQTGRMTGELPVDKGAFWKYLIGMTACGTVIFSVIGLLLGGMLF